MQNWYFIKLWNKSKLLFFVLLVFCIMQLYFNQKRIHNFPWFVWDMYSRYSEPPKQNSLFVYYLDGKPYNHTQLSIFQEEVLFYTSKQFRWLVQYNYQDPSVATIKKRTQHLPIRIQDYAIRNISNQGEDYMYYTQWVYDYLKKTNNLPFTKLELKELKLELQNNKYLPTTTQYTYIVEQQP